MGGYGVKNVQIWLKIIYNLWITIWATSYYTCSIIPIVWFSNVMLLASSDLLWLQNMRSWPLPPPLGPPLPVPPPEPWVLTPCVALSHCYGLPVAVVRPLQPSSPLDSIVSLLLAQNTSEFTSFCGCLMLHWRQWHPNAVPIHGLMRRNTFWSLFDDCVWYELWIWRVNIIWWPVYSSVCKGPYGPKHRDDVQYMP